ncbi:heavy-metal-associated domain-containing protein [Demequina mangrovi]|uniref:Heavy-metal-associated domain-containing protein n=1 Tax=Demequina mangrovi TaxID=1043493 RepID=A0A1H6ZYJ3_9MICO|nr:heavy metal-associated domain-containing protein [Demequina mangrovi]SEJ57264.1 Heavy-metal-associated domain-containing protein [Demequina mangrovi]
MTDLSLAGTSGTVLDLAVSGMTCDGCSSSVHDALVALPGVRSASVDHATGRAVVLLAPEVVAEDFAFEADAAVHDAGYTLESAHVTATAAAAGDRASGEGCCGADRAETAACATLTEHDDLPANCCAATGSCCS